MEIVYTKHAEDKLRRKDIVSFKITKDTIKKILARPGTKTKTKYGNWASVRKLNTRHDLRVVYDIMDTGMKVITFHIAKKGRY